MSKVYSIKDITNYENHIGYDLKTPDGKDIRFSDNIEHNPFMYNEIKEILDKLNNCKWEKDLEEVTYKILFSNEVYKLLDYITNLQEKAEYNDLVLKALHRYFTEHECYDTHEFLRQLESCTKNDMVWLKRMAGDNNE